LVPCKAPWVRAKSPFGPGVSDSPIAARAYKDQVCHVMSK